MRGAFGLGDFWKAGIKDLDWRDLSEEDKQRLRAEAEEE